ncbi:MAG: hypothetical protein IPH44_11015 [Myxococcales bacterium]|jgi:hypothetical protein|nr:hypothetical protein [Myxococcales bacterium]
MKSLVSLALVPALALAVVAARATDASAACSKIECGSNSPVIDLYEFHELNEIGLPNTAGLRVRYLVASGVTYRADVIGARLVGRDLASNAVVVEHGALTGAHLELISPSGQLYKLSIDHVTLSTPFWVGAAASPGAESYELNYTGGNITQKTPVCSLPPRGTQLAKESVLFSGERFVAETKRVKAAAADDGNWFNIGCYNHVLYKLFYTRNTVPSSALGYALSRAYHQAMLKMYVGDVCGNGNAFTTQGTPLFWNNPPYNWGSAVLGQDVLEGVWGPNGALCIDDYRKGATYYQGVVAPACGSQLPPTCASAYPSLSPFPSNAYLFTSIPQALP